MQKVITRGFGPGKNYIMTRGFNGFIVTEIIINLVSRLTKKIEKMSVLIR